LLSETHLKTHRRFYVRNCCFYWTGRFLGRKGIPHNHVDLPLLASIETTGACIPTGNSEVILAVVCKSPGYIWNDADIIELLSFRHKPLLAGNLNAKHPFWNSIVSNPSGEKLLNLLPINEFEISAPCCLSYYSPVGNSDVLDIVVHKNFWLLELIFSDILDSDNLPIIFPLLDHVRTGNLSDTFDKFTD
jgi:hypothetical protein